MSLREQAVLDVVAHVEAAGIKYGEACRREMELEDERSMLKPQAVRRIMQRDNIAYTPAEKIVETDEEYMSLRRRQYTCVADKERALGEFKAAELRAKLSVGLATVSL
ncbi:MAG: hypothetical protein JWL61_4047 [Gemmatimonadetes bacterium]|nr:hypothetical protein [Gemmatimonadota bacterium]